MRFFRFYNYSNTMVYFKDGKGPHMRVFGVVCECNPYHSGHGKLIENAFALGADKLVAVMSGDFVQRGEPAVLSKFDRAADLVEQGFSLVFELPVRYSLSSSERFAAASVGLLDALGAVDRIIFGSESGDLEALTRVSRAVDDPKTRELVRELCGRGYSYPGALSSALTELFGSETVESLSGPNNLLAIDYLRALASLGSGIEPVTYRREADGFSAHSVREMMENSADAGGYVTERTRRLIEDGNTVSMQKWDTVCISLLRRLEEDRFASLPDMSGGLENRLFRASRQAATLSEFLSIAKTKSYTMSRIKRAAACAACGIFGEAPDVPPYARILAIGRGGKELLREISASSALPVSENLISLSSVSPAAARTAEEEIRATDSYNVIRRIPLPAGEDLSRKLTVID